MFSMAVWRGTIAGPLHWRAGWQTGSLARPIALNAYFCQENCPLVNYPNETMSSLPLTAHYAPLRRSPLTLPHLCQSMAEHPGGDGKRHEGDRRQRPKIRYQLAKPGPFQVHAM